VCAKLIFVCVLTKLMQSTKPDRHIPVFLMDNPLRRLSRPMKTLSKYVSEGDVVADLGSGPGFHTLVLLRLVDPKGKVYAVDSDKAAIERLRKRSERKGFLNLDARVGSAANLGHIPSASVDFVLADGLLCCTTAHTQVVAEIQRIMKTDAQTFIRVTRFLRASDPRTVSAREWEDILSGFRVVQKGGLASMWALVEKQTEETGHPSPGRQSRENLGPW
jgi:ubiquinone/menaquinone biosynthesis C-methylase UbiE